MEPFFRATSYLNISCLEKYKAWNCVILKVIIYRYCTRLYFSIKLQDTGRQSLLINRFYTFSYDISEEKSPSKIFENGEY